MNVVILSSTSSYHYLAQAMAKESTVYHYGAHVSCVQNGNYIPVPKWIPPTAIDGPVVLDFLKFIEDKNIGLVMAAGLPVCRSRYLHGQLRTRQVPYFWVNPDVTDIERDKSVTKQLLKKLNIPTADYRKVDGKYLFENFKTIPRPFVIKLNFAYQYGRQTIIVKDDNWEECFDDLFSMIVTGDKKITNIDFDADIVLEDYINIKREYSYHALFNKTEWKYLGSARDYKKLGEGDVGYNTAGLGCYNVTDVDPVVHEYADKIYKFLKLYLGPKNDFYKGFIFLGIGVDQNNIPHILEINTRSGDPELASIVGSLDCNLTELFHAASSDLEIPDVKHNNKSTVSVRIFNKTYDWTRPASYLPNFKDIPNNIIHSIDGQPNHDGTDAGDNFYLKHSIFTTTADTRQEAATRLYDYLDSQHLGQYTYRRDIGLLE